jgi:hypothetical protein
VSSLLVHYFSHCFIQSFTSRCPLLPKINSFGRGIPSLFRFPSACVVPLHVLALRM